MRNAEWINVIYFSFVAALAPIWPLPRNARLMIVGIGLAGAGAAAAAQQADAWIRDWLPAPLMVMAYRQAGLFFRKPLTRLQNALERIDSRILMNSWRRRPHGLSSVLATYSEAAYLLCYPMVPGGLLTLYLLDMRAHADEFWLVVLPSAYLCYVTVPFLPTLPPRMVGQDKTLSPAESVVRGANISVLRYASIGANTFPSAHVSASFAVALVLTRLAPAAGAIFMVLAISIAVACAAQRYHFAADVILGALLALIVFVLAGGA